MNIGAGIAVSASLVFLTTLLAINIFGLPSGIVLVSSLMAGLASVFSMAFLFGGKEDAAYMKSKEEQRQPSLEREEGQVRKTDHTDRLVEGRAKGDSAERSWEI